MGIVGIDFSMPLEALIAGPGDDRQHVFKRYCSGNADFRLLGGEGMGATHLHFGVVK